MAGITAFLKVLYGHESGYSNVTSDKGGETYRGISRVNHPGWEGWRIIDGIKAKRVIKRYEVISDPALEGSVYNFYLKEFWNPMRGDGFISQDTANVVIDHAVNAGPGRAAKMVQHILRNNFNASLAIDGNIGPVTLNTLNKVNQAKFFNAFVALRKDFYDYRANISTRGRANDALFKSMQLTPDSGEQVNYTGWMKRVASFGTKTIAAASAGTLFFFGLSLF
jgi:lysozyme family protein